MWALLLLPSATVHVDQPVALFSSVMRGVRPRIWSAAWFASSFYFSMLQVSMTLPGRPRG